MIADTVRLVVALADENARFDAAQRLARHAGAEVLLVLVEDRAVDAYLPAHGFPPVLPGGTGWRDLLRAAEAPGFHRGTVAYPSAGVFSPALAWADCGVVLVFVGGTPREDVLGEIKAVFPLLAAMLRAERAAAAAEGERQVALKRARETEALATALDAARSELERTLLALEERTRALDEARARAERAVLAKDEFLAMLSHELRNPLSPIVTAVQLLRLKGQVGREHEVIERQVGNLIRLVDDLLDVSRLTTGKIVLRKEIVEIADVAARAIEMVSPLIERKRQVLIASLPPQGLAVYADPARLAQVLANLLTNASKYSDEDTRIRLDACSMGAHVQIRVTDEGIGIRPEMLDRIFELFTQERQALERSQGGLGIGLAVVRGLVAAHGGTVRASSEGEGRGAEFTVELPLAGAARERSADEAVPAEPPSVGAGWRVLVVDDNQDALALTTDALRLAGYDVRVAADPPEALAVSESFRPHVAVLDLGLPMMSGYELAERLRMLEGLAGLKLVAVTGYGQEIDRVRTGEAGFDAHLVKPVALDELQRVLARLCAGTGSAA